MACLIIEITCEAIADSTIRYRHRLSLFRQPADIIVCIECTNACFIRVACIETNRVNLFDNAARKIIDVPFQYDPIWPSNLD